MVGVPKPGRRDGCWAIRLPPSVITLTTAPLEVKSVSGVWIRSGSIAIRIWLGSSRAASDTWRLKSERILWTVSEPIATANAHRITNVSSAETPARRTRIGSRSKATDSREGGLAPRRRAGRYARRT